MILKMLNLTSHTHVTAAGCSWRPRLSARNSLSWKHGRRLDLSHEWIEPCCRKAVENTESKKKSEHKS